MLLFLLFFFAVALNFEDRMVTFAAFMPKIAKKYINEQTELNQQSR